MGNSRERGRSGPASEGRRAFLEEKLSLNWPVRGARRHPLAVPRVPRIVLRDKELAMRARDLAPRRYCWRCAVESGSSIGTAPVSYLLSSVNIFIKTTIMTHPVPDCRKRQTPIDQDRSPGPDRNPGEMTGTRKTSDLPGTTKHYSPLLLGASRSGHSAFT